MVFFWFETRGESGSDDTFAVSFETGTGNKNFNTSSFPQEMVVDMDERKFHGAIENVGS